MIVAINFLTYQIILDLVMFTFDEKEQMKIGKTHTWWDLYKPAFLKEMETRKDFQAN